MERDEVLKWPHAGEVLRAIHWGLIYEPVFSVQDQATLEINRPEPLESSAKISCPDSTIRSLPEMERSMDGRKNKKKQE